MSDLATKEDFENTQDFVIVLRPPVWFSECELAEKIKTLLPDGFSIIPKPIAQFVIFHSKKEKDFDFSFKRTIDKLKLLPEGLFRGWVVLNDYDLVFDNDVLDFIIDGERVAFDDFFKQA